MSDPSPITAPPLSLLRRYGWPVGIAVVLLASMAGNFTMMYVARNDPSFAVEPDYYRKAVEWDATMEQGRRNSALGWHGEASITLGNPGRLSVVITDAAQQRVNGAHVTAVALHNARANDRMQLTLTEGSDPGVYGAPLDATRPGEWEVRLAVERGADRFTEVARLTVK